MTDTLPPRIEVSLFTKDGVPWCRCNDAPAEVGCCCDHMEKERPTPPSALELARLIKQARSGGGNGYPYDVCRKLADACEALLARRPQESARNLVEKAKAFDEAAIARDEAGFLGSPAECIRYLLALSARPSFEGGERE